MNEDKHPVYEMFGDEYLDVEIRIERKLGEKLSKKQDAFIRWLMDDIRRVIMQSVDGQEEVKEI